MSYQIRRGQTAFWLGILSLLRVFPASSGVPAVSVETQPTVTDRYEFRREHNPEGTGRFYQGREIALVMGHEAATWLERPERQQQEHSEELIQELRIKPGQVVADIGAGTGYFSRRLAGQVGPTGKVLAVDIQPEMLRILTNNMAWLKITNVVPVLGSSTETRLPERSVDLALLVDVYHEFDCPCEMMQSIIRSLKPGGRVVFVEYRAEDAWVPIKVLHKMSEAQVRKEMAAHPLEWIRTSRTLPWQHIIEFRLPMGVPTVEMGNPK